MPKVSVMMLVYNTERYVERAVRSILDQDLADFELIVIDDGSTDRSAGLVRRFAAADPRIRLVSRENRGITASRNEALALATGEYLAVMDSDDVSLPGRLSRQARHLDEHPECVMVCCRMQMIDSDGDPIRVINLESTHDEIDAMNLGGLGFFIPVPIMARRRELVAIGGFSEEFPLAEDRDLCLRLAERGRLAGLPEVLYLYRQHARSVCRRNPALLNSCIERVVAEARRRRGLAPAAAPAPAVAPTAGDVAPSEAETHRTWAWWALGAGNVATARKHAAASLAREPLSTQSWRLFYCALRGH